MQRRSFLKGIAATGIGLLAPEALALTFEEYKARQTQSFDDYQARFRAAQLVFRQEVRQFWLQDDLSSQHEFIRYSRDLQVRSRIDFKAGTITLEAQGSTPAEAGKKVKEALGELLQLDTREAYREDQVQQLVDRDALNGNSEQLASEPVIGDLFTGKNVTDILEPAIKSIEEDRRPVAKVVIKLPPGSTAQKASKYLPFAEQYGQKEKISAALIMAVTHTESSFNPMARSPVPAFGLMQIVPESAGKDVTDYLEGRMRLMTAAELYQAENNMRSGTAYLHLLYYRYLADIKDPISRLYCTIAAYNTGAGNVARAFTGRNSVSQAAQKINRMQSQQVYAYLQKNLPHQETRNYLVKVSERLPLYRS